MTPSSWVDFGSLIAGMIVGAIGALAGVRLRGKAPPKGDALRK